MIKADNLKKRYGNKVSSFELNDINIKKELTNAELLLNCTPIGMSPNHHSSPVPLDNLRKDLAVFDAIYNPITTLLIKSAKDQGAKTLGGIKMFLYQGVEAFELWTKKKAPVEVMEKIIIKNLTRK